MSKLPALLLHWSKWMSPGHPAVRGFIVIPVHRAVHLQLVLCALVYTSVDSWQAGCLEVNLLHSTRIRNVTGWMHLTRPPHLYIRKIISKSNRLSFWRINSAAYSVKTYESLHGLRFLSVWLEWTINICVNPNNMSCSFAPFLVYNTAEIILLKLFEKCKKIPVDSTKNVVFWYTLLRMQFSLWATEPLPLMLWRIREVGGVV